MMRDMGNRIVRESDPRVVTRRKARSFQIGFAPKRQTCSLWPRVCWASCRSCKQTYRAAPRGGSYHSDHDPHACYRQREKWANES